ncbi:MAG: NAD(P)-dependent oxidoreductase [Candidatus Lokiarchaeota archaeon]|nr:NAD(P)-dependent oxidoreductase [Candidatus Lokiarchaeota archaeon]
MEKESVFLAGASGSMGFEAFKQLWNRKDEQGNRKYNIVLLQRPSKKNKTLFKPYEKKAGITSIEGKGIVENNGFKIVWGDATSYNDVEEACKGIDWVLCPMAFISPAADRNPKMAKAVNTGAIKHIIKAIESQPNGAEHIKFIYVGSVAETGDRLQSIHVGRIGDPMKPSVFDFYATTKIRGERALMESNIKHWASLRQTFIMIPDIMSLQDPIMFHQPLDSFMENNTAEDAGRGLVNALDIPDDSDFWRRAYNMGGGPSCRITFFEFMRITFDMIGLDYHNIMERQWFALRNFHMQYFEDSHVLNDYIHNWNDTLDDYIQRVHDNMPWYMKLVAKLCKKVKPFKNLVENQTYKRLKKMAERPDGTLGWYNNRNDMRISAFFGSYKAFENIPDWDVDMPQMDPEPKWHRLDHGYDESKDQLAVNDLREAAEFRGGTLLSTEWSGDLYETLHWKCAFGHEFDAKPYTVIKAGIWCPECLAPPWNYDEIAKKNKFFAQIWYPNHSKDENNFYPEDCYKDIEGLSD